MEGRRVVGFILFVFSNRGLRLTLFKVMLGSGVFVRVVRVGSRFRELVSLWVIFGGRGLCSYFIYY